MFSERRLLSLLGIGAVGVVAFLAYAWRPALAPVDPPAPSSFARELVAKGEMLASAGNCAACHTSSSGARYAGGHRLVTPFGVVESTNITPDPQTGIGRWSEAAFARALREGVARDGSHLFPAFPFDHFTKLTDDDIKALYAYFMTVPPVKAATGGNTLPFPLNMRVLQAGWKMLYLDKGPYRPDTARSAEWNRGAYLAEGIAHCGACHTLRNVFAAESVGHPYGGALVEGWYASALDVSPSPARWTAEGFATYLRGGTTLHGRAIGPMGPVVKGLAALPDADIKAMAAYLAEFNRPKSPTADAAAAAVLVRRPIDKGSAKDRGARLYLAACGSCHDRGSTTPLATQADLAVSTALWQNRPHTFIQVVLDGVGSERDAPGPMMPPFRQVLSDDDIADIAHYLRRTFTDQPSWPQLADAVGRVRADPISLPWHYQRNN